MKYENVCIESFTCTLPEEILSTEELEERLRPVYERLKLPRGRLEMLTGIRERRLWKPGTRIGDQSAKTCRKLLESCEIERTHIGAFLHGSVCRDFLEPATACGVHRQLELPDECTIFDISNACLGIATGMVQIANMIELGHIEAGIVVGTESSRSLIDSTVHHLNTDSSLTRKSIKNAFASLTIGSGSAAVLLTHRRISRSQMRFLGAVIQSDTQFSQLCESATDQSGGDAMSPLMRTDSEALMIHGINTAHKAVQKFFPKFRWTPDSVDRYLCHQVGKKHQQLLFEQLGLPVEKNFSTLEYLGNTGSAAMLTAAAICMEEKAAKPGDRLALFGIGSGINTMMLAIE